MDKEKVAKELLALAKELMSGCEKLPEGGMRDNCEKKVEEGKKDDKKEAGCEKRMAASGVSSQIDRLIGSLYATKASLKDARKEVVGLRKELREEGQLDQSNARTIFILMQDTNELMQILTLIIGKIENFRWRKTQ
jgi:hypothetical protein